MRRRVISVVVLLTLLVILTVPTFATNDPGHDSLYVLKLGDSNVTGSINIAGNLTAELVQATGRFFGPNIDIRGDGSSSTANNRVIGGSASLEISTTGDLYLNKGATGGMVYVGWPGTTTGLNVSGNTYVGGTLYQQGVGVCLANGTNCLTGNNSGNISTVAAGDGISVANPNGPTATVSLASGSAGDGLGYSGGVLSVNTGTGLTTSGDNVQIDSTVCTTSNGLCGTASSSAGWNDDGTTTSTSLDVNVTARNASAVPLTIHGASSQTGNLQEWQDSGGGVIAEVDEGGNFLTGNNQRFGVIGNNYWYFKPFTTTPAHFSQYAQEFNIWGYPGRGWEFNDRSTNRLWIDSLTGDVGMTGALNITGGNATKVQLAIKGAASQSANLTEWQDNNSVVLASVNASGTIFDASGQVCTASNGLCSGSSSGAGWTNDSTTTSTDLDVNITTGNLTIPNGYVGIGTDSPTTKLDVKGIVIGDSFRIVDGSTDIKRDGNYLRVYGGNGIKLSVWNGGFVDAMTIAKTTGNVGIGTDSPDGVLDVNISNSTIAGLIVQGAPSQSANLQEWKNSGGSVLAYVNASGTIFDASGQVCTASNGLCSGTDTVWSLTGDYLYNNSGSLDLNETKLNATIDARAGDISGSGTRDKLAKFTGSGTIGDSIISESKSTATVSGNLDLQGGNITIGSADSISDRYIKGVSTLQPYNFNLHLKSPDAAGPSGTAGTNLYLDAGAPVGPGTPGNILLMTEYMYGNVGIGATAPEAKLEVNTGISGTKGIIVQGASSQTANLQEWQDSSGSVRAYMNSSAGLYLNSTAIIGPELDDSYGENTGTVSKLFISRAINDYGPHTTGLYAFRYGNENTREGGTSWSLDSVDSAITAESYWGNSYSAGIAGYSYLDYVNSTAIIGALYDGSVFGALAYSDANANIWAGYFQGNVSVSGTLNATTVNATTVKTNLLQTSDNAVVQLPGSDYKFSINTDGLGNGFSIIPGDNVTFTRHIPFIPTVAKPVFIFDEGGYIHTGDKILYVKNSSGGEAFSVTNIGSAYANGSEVCTVANGLCNQSFSDTNTQWNLTGSGWLYNNSGILEWNETKGNATYLTSTPYQNSAAGWTNTSTTTSTGLDVNITSRAASAVPLTIHGASSQTGNLQEWQDNTGAVLAYMDSAGGLTLPAFHSLNWGSATYSIAGQGGGTAFQFKSWAKPFKFVGAEGTYLTIDTSGNVGIGTTNPTAKLEVNTTLANATGLIIQGVSSQTANLTEWQDNTSAVLAYVSSSGTIYDASGRVCTASNGLCGGTSSGAGWTNDSTTTSTSLDVNVNSGTFFVNSTSGKVGINTTDPNATLHVVGDANITGDLSYGGTLTGYGADIAEFITGDESLQPGDVVVIDTSKDEAVLKSTQPYDTLVAGIVSTAPGHTLSAGKGNVKLALAGRVPVKVTTSNGAIKRGDLLTTSGLPGEAMRCDDRTKCVGAILGKALEPLDKGEGKITALVTLG